MGSNGTKARGASRAPGRNCGLSSEMGALWDFLQMNLKATGLPCRSATLAAMLGNRLQWLGIQAERPQEALHHQGEPRGEAITVALKKGLDLEFILKMETRGFPDRLCPRLVPSPFCPLWDWPSRFPPAGTLDGKDMESQHLLPGTGASTEDF